MGNKYYIQYIFNIKRGIKWMIHIIEFI